MPDGRRRHFPEFRGYWQKYMAKQLGKIQAAYSKIENGTTHLSDQMIEKLSLIGITTDMFGHIPENKEELKQLKSNQKKLQKQIEVLTEFNKAV
jgi:transcriptional regulator with XRE-family HTH domain